ncbi:MAG: response regulator [Legionellaceae bacterium]|nr:response regulator [Legionellaceae bacterium]
MSFRPQIEINKKEQSIQSYYTKILNCMPFLIYWVDESCKIQGFNANISKILNIYSKEEAGDKFHEKLAKAIGIPEKEIESFKIDDMATIFSGQEENNVQLNTKNTSGKKYLCTRNPIRDEQNKIVGAVIIIMDEIINNPIKTPKKVQQKTIDSNVSTTRVLIVEDNETSQKVEKSLFMSLNCEVDSVSSGKEAMSIFKPGKYNLVMMDIGLEDSSGYFLSKQFRELEENTDFHAIIIALTSYKPEDVLNDCKYYKMEGAIGKPLNKDQADQIIQHYIYDMGNHIDGLE